MGNGLILLCLLRKLPKFFKMASLLAVQTLFSTPKKFFVDPPSMAYGKSRNAKKPDLGLFILELLAKIKKKWKKLTFFG